MTNILFLCLIAVLALAPSRCSYHQPHRVALGSQGTSSSMMQWIDMYSKMNASSYVTLFLVTFDTPVSYTIFTLEIYFYALKYYLIVSSLRKFVVTAE